MIAQYCQVAFGCNIRVGYSEFCESRFAITQSAWHAIHSSNIFQHISSGPANCESSAPFGNQSTVSSHRILSVHLEATPSCRQVASGKCQVPSGKCGVWSCMSAPRREKCAT